MGLSPKPAPTPVQPIGTGYSEVVERVQKQLQALGYAEVGIADGLFGQKTRDMIKAFSADNGLPASTGEITDAFLAALPKAKHRPVSEQRANTTAKDLRQAGNEPAKSLNNLGWIGNIIGLGGVVGGLNETGVFDSIKSAADTATGTISTIQGVLVTVINAVQWVVAHWWLFAIIAALWIVFKVAKGVLELVVLFRQGILQRASSGVAPIV
jgi:peptidoglycan hydrolase-like protein with peptidoglycan-binding domain